LRQGLTWLFQILPYLEEDAISTITKTPQIVKLAIPLYNCPSRRPPTFSQDVQQRALVDYCGVVGGPARSEIGDVEFDEYLADQPPTYNKFKGTQDDVFWGYPGGGGSGNQRYLGNLDDAVEKGLMPKFRGILQRCDWFKDTGVSPPLYRHIGFMSKVTVAKISDGTTKTLLISEKWVPPSMHEGTGGVMDDRGWSDGWDFDTMRSSLIRPLPDSAGYRVGGHIDPLAYTLGSSHPGGFNVAFGDGAVSTIDYDIDLETLNRLGNRLDGEVAEGY
jgi:prepilin-type processing-associated H-X9-DG protein